MRTLPLLALVACGGSEIRLDPRFEDPFFGAAARRLEVVAFEGVDCDTLHQLPPDDVVEALGPPLFVKTTQFPPRSGSRPLAPAPRGRAVTLALHARREDGRAVGRGCITVSLSEDSATISVPLELRPRCARPAAAIDLAVAFDTSAQALVADIALSERLREAVAELVFEHEWPAGSRLSLVRSRSQGGPEVVSGPPAQLSQAVRSARFQGPARAVDLMLEAMVELRSRSSCAHRPVLLSIVASGEGGGALPIEVRLLAAGGARSGDDALFLGVGLNPESVDLLEASAPEGGEVSAPRTEAALRAELERLIALTRL